MSYSTTTRTFSGQPATHVHCWCGIQFAVPTMLYSYYERTNDEQPNSFALWCPLGHQMVPSDPHGPSNKLRDELAREKHRAEQATSDAEYQRRRAAMKDRQLSARKGQMTKLRKRISNGVCPCCNRTFRDLQRHMQGQHPNWTPENIDGIALTTEGITMTSDWAALRSCRLSLGIPGSLVAAAIGVQPGTLNVYETGGAASERARAAVAAFLLKKLESHGSSHGPSETHEGSATPSATEPT